MLKWDGMTAVVLSTRTFLFFSPIPFIVFVLLLQLPLYLVITTVPVVYIMRQSRVAQIRGHKAGSSPPSPLLCYTTYGACLAFLSREKLSIFFPRRMASNCAYTRFRQSLPPPFPKHYPRWESKSSRRPYCLKISSRFTTRRSGRPAAVSCTRYKPGSFPILYLRITYWRAIFFFFS